MKMALGAFACSCLHSGFGPDLVAGAESAVRQYGRRLEDERDRVKVPVDFRSRVEPSVIEVDLRLGAEVEASLEREARIQAVALRDLLTHAVFVYGAEQDRRRVACGPRERNSGVSALPG